MLSARKKNVIGNSSLLFWVVMIVFVAPVLPPGIRGYAFSALLNIIFFISILALKEGRKKMLIFAIVITLVSIVSDVVHLQSVYVLARLSAFVFFIIVVIRLLRQIIRSRRVDANVIVEAITGYLLLGLTLALVVLLFSLYAPDAFRIPPELLQGEQGDLRFSIYLYYTFVTYTTLGYGDIAPVHPIARSLAAFIAIVGQVYIAAILALLVGKFAGEQGKNLHK